jgi:hypothetical protein
MGGAPASGVGMPASPPLELPEPLELLLPPELLVADPPLPELLAPES